MSQPQRLLDLLKADTSKDKPKRMYRNGRLTKKFLKWNRKMIDERRINYYAGITEGEIYDPITRRTRKVPLDKRKTGMQPTKKGREMVVENAKKMKQIMKIERVPKKGEYTVKLVQHVNNFKNLLYEFPEPLTLKQMYAFAMQRMKNIWVF